MHEMTPLLQHQDSYALYGKNFHGCRWSILQLFGFRRHLRSLKTLSDRKHGEGKGSDGNKFGGSYVPLKCEEDYTITNIDENVQGTKKQKASKMNSGKTNLRTLFLRKLYGKQGQKQKMLPVASKLLRTISVHYLESDDYVLRSEINSVSNSSSFDLSVQNDISSQRVTSNSLDFHGSDGRDDRIGESHVKILRKEVDEDKKSHQRISMDGILHRVPYGRKVSEDIKESLVRSASATYDRESLKPNIGNATKMHANQSFQRSRSLTESLERYSQLLDSISSGESQRLLRSSKSTRDHSSKDPIATITFQRNNSSPEFRSKSLARHAQNVVIQEAISSQMLEQSAVDRDLKVGMNENSGNGTADDHENLVSLDDCGSVETCEFLESTKQDLCTVPLPFEAAEVLEKQESICDHDPVHSCKVSESIEGESPVLLQEVEAKAHLTCEPEVERIESKPDLVCEPEAERIEAKADLVCEQETESPMSVLLPGFLDDTDSPVKYRILEDPKLKERILHFIDPNDASVDVHVPDTDGSTSPSRTPPTLDNEHHNSIADLDAFNIQVDEKNEEEFNYVKDILEQSSFASEALFDDWYSQNFATLQEEDCQHYEVGIAACDFSDMSADQLLLFDLTNEILLEIYKKHSAHKSRLSRFASCHRPKPAGHSVLRDLWSQVSCHLNPPSHTSLQLDNVLAHDLTKNDGWASFQRDTYHLGAEMADFVLDKLLNELILQFAKL